MCAVIMKSKTPIPPSWVMGIDPMANIVDAETEDEFVMKNKESMSGGPTCVFRGKEVPCFVTYSPKASITSTLLMEMLKYLDSLGVYDNEQGQRPFLLLDGHHSRMELPFLEYIMSEEHWWTCCFGVPYGTHIWQVADSTEQNGCFKMALAKAKRAVTNRRDDAKFYQTDIIPLVKIAWEQSFARVHSNKKAICDRGWFPLNKALLLHPLVLKSKPTDDDDDTVQRSSNDGEAAYGEPKDVPNIPFNNKHIEKLHREHLKQFAASKKAAEQRDHRKEQKELQEKLRKATAYTRFTSTELASKGEYSLNIEDMVQCIKKKNEDAQMEAEAKARKRQAIDEKRDMEYKAARTKYKNNQNNPQTLTRNELRAFVAKLPGDSPMKMNKKDLLDQFERRRRRLCRYDVPSPTQNLKDPPSNYTTEPDDDSKKASV